MNTNNLPTPAIYHDRRRQLRGLIVFHRRAESAFRAVGKIEDAESAKAEADKLQRELDEMERGK